MPSRCALNRYGSETTTGARESQHSGAPEVAGAIKRAGGEEIEREAMAKGPIAVGEAVATGAGNLPHAAVIHAAAMGYQGGRMIPATVETVRHATASAMRVADDIRVTSVAFPALGAGVGGLDLAACASAMVGAVKDHFDAHPACWVNRVLFVVRSNETRQVFGRVLSGS